MLAFLKQPIKESEHVIQNIYYFLELRKVKPANLPLFWLIFVGLPAWGREPQSLPLSTPVADVDQAFGNLAFLDFLDLYFGHFVVVLVSPQYGNAFAFLVGVNGLNLAHHDMGGGLLQLFL